jgi:hypothetical protein
MAQRSFSLAAVLAFFAAATASAAAPEPARLYRIELSGGGVVFSDDAPMQSGEQILFHGHPAGALQSLRRADVRRIVATSFAPTPGTIVKPGQAVDLGITGTSGPNRSAPAKAPPRGNAPLKPGEGKGATALFNPDRAYRPDWDGKLVPGATMGLPNSANDYKEGVTLAHPAAGATQSAPGEPPMMKPSSGEPPTAPKPN